MKNLHQLMGKTDNWNQNDSIKFTHKILTLNVSGLNALIKRHRLANWIKSQNHQCAVSRKHVSHARICKGSK